MVGQAWRVGTDLRVVHHTQPGLRVRRIMYPASQTNFVIFVPCPPVDMEGIVEECCERRYGKTGRNPRGAVPGR
jgi:hypothetical protein